MSKAEAEDGGSTTRRSACSTFRCTLPHFMQPDVSRRLPRVLIVEDEPAIRRLLSSALGAETLTVDLAPDGVVALERVREHEYAVILLDLMMPRLDGLEFLRAYGELQIARRAVVFVMTAFDETMLRKLDPALVHGVIRKPFDVLRLVTMVRDCAAITVRGAAAKLDDVTLDGSNESSPTDVC